jgi:hypothetical protein
VTVSLQQALDEVNEPRIAGKAKDQDLHHDQAYAIRAGPPVFRWPTRSATPGRAHNRHRVGSPDGGLLAHIGSRLPRGGPRCARRAEVVRLGTGRVRGGYVARVLFAGSGFGLLKRSWRERCVHWRPRGRRKRSCLRPRTSTAAVATEPIYAKRPGRCRVDASNSRTQHSGQR